MLLFNINKNLKLDALFCLKKSWSLVQLTSQLGMACDYLSR